MSGSCSNSAPRCAMVAPELKYLARLAALELQLPALL
jgi:hypothetical protein